MNTDANQRLLVLRGDGHVRGLLQAQLCPLQIAAVREAVEGRLLATKAQRSTAAVSSYLHAQREFAQRHDHAGIAETSGIADGFGLRMRDLFDYLHMNIVDDMAQRLAAPTTPVDGCTAWAAARGGAAGAWVVKNRDYRGEHGALQRVFLHADPAWSGRSYLCIGSLGSPGAFSSGINSEGLAVVDTQIGTRDHGVGWLRYFLMSHLLRTCTSVEQALDAIKSMQHAGGGTLVLGDALGATAAVELGHRNTSIEMEPAGWVVRTNHYTDLALADMSLPHADHSLAESSAQRRQTVADALLSGHASMDIEAIQALMSGHGAEGRHGLCRHADGGASRTLASVIYSTRDASLLMSHGNPCTAQWQRYSIART